jgi:hypothetical protein
VRLASEAVEIGQGTVDLLLRGDALTDLGEVFLAIGRDVEAGPPLREALACFERKGATTAASRIRRLLDGAAVS